MIEVVASALVETLAKYIFKSMLNRGYAADIEGAPSWYMQRMDDKVCTFSHKENGFSSLDLLVNDTKYKLTKKLDTMVEITIYDNLDKISNEKEKRLIEIWKKDPRLKIFVEKNVDFERVFYDEDTKIAFARSCISKDKIYEYQKNRLNSIKKKVLNYKSDRAMDELDRALNKGPSSSMDLFEELENELR